jgi:hypothetical protein
MVIGEYMTTQNYLMVEANVVTNIVLWDGNTESWNPPQDAIMLVQENTPVIDWVWNVSLQDYELVEIPNEVASIGYTYNGNDCVTNEPKPFPPEPIPEPTQE